MKYNWIAIVVSLILLIILLLYSNIFKIFNLLLRANPFFIFIGFLLWFVGAITRSLRWKFLLKTCKINLSLKDSMHVYIPSLFLSNVSPGKVGDVLRSVLLKGMKRKSISKSLPSVFVERILDLCILISISLIGTFLLSKTLFIPLILSILIYSIVFIMGVFILISPKRTRFVLSKLTFVFLVKRIKSKLYKFSNNLSKSFIKYKDFKTLTIGLVYTFLVWLIEGVILLVAFKTIGISLSIWLTMFVISVSILFGVISFLPGGLGVNEAISIILLTHYNLTPSQVMAAMLFDRFYGFWVYVFLGSIILAASKYKFK